MSKDLQIIGIGGTNGSGKDTLCQILADDYGWFALSVSADLIIPELESQGLPLERKQMSTLTTAWRQKEGMGACVDRALELYKKQTKTYKGLAIASLRHPGEAERIHQLGGKVIWIDADSVVRYKRIYSRGHGKKDKKSYAQFLAEEQYEMKHDGHSATLNMVGVKQKADFIIENNEDDLSHIKYKISRLLRAPGS